MKRIIFWLLAVVLTIPTVLAMLEGLTEDTNSVTALRLQCAAGIQRPCVLLGWRYRSGGRGVEQNLPRAEQLFQRACDAGNGYGCRSLAYWYAGWTYAGAPTDEGERRLKAVLEQTKDEAKSVQLSERACQLDDGQSCDDAGRRYYYGQGVPQDHGRAIELWRRGCEQLSYSFACSSLGNAYREMKDEARASAAYRHGGSKLPLLLWLWLGSVVAALATGIVLTVMNKGITEGRSSPRLWTAVGSLFGGAYVLTGFVVATTAKKSAWAGWILMFLGVIALAGVVSLRLKRYTAAHVLFAGVGFLAVAPGLLTVVVAREIRDSLAAKGATQKSHAAS